MASKHSVGSAEQSVEAPLMRPDPGLADAARELRDRGFGVLIGHPERSRYTTVPTVRELVEEGSVIQINASSLVGGHGAETARRALEIVRSGLPFVLASDAHTPRRPPLLTRGAAALAAAGFSRGLIQFAVDHGPERLLREGLPLSWPALAAVG